MSIEYREEVASADLGEEAADLVLFEQVPPSLIQIKAASEAEVNRRIQVFIQNKRSEVDERNVREFILPQSSEPESSCARVEAVYIHREGQKSHITLKSVENITGPQTHLSEADVYGPVVTRLPVGLQRVEAVEERLQNIEAHLNMKSDSQSIFSRIKALEERILFLEGISPEYFTPNIPKKPKLLEATNESKEKRTDSQEMAEPRKKTESLSDVNSRIQQLRQLLKIKQKQGLDS